MSRGLKAESAQFLVPVVTQEVPAPNPLTGQAITRSEPVDQNQSVEAIDTLHRRFVGDRLIEWTIVREEKKQFTVQAGGCLHFNGGVIGLDARIDP